LNEYTNYHSVKQLL